MTTNDHIDALANEVTCIFSLSGKDFDPAEVVGQLALPGLRVWHRRNASTVGHIDLPDAAVELTCGPLECSSIDDVANDLLQQIAGHESTVLGVADGHKLSVALTCLVRVYTQPPLYVISAGVISALASVKAEFSLDVVDLRRDRSNA
jgi:hypothetical protein